MLAFVQDAVGGMPTLSGQGLPRIIEHVRSTTGAAPCRRLSCRRRAARFGGRRLDDRLLRKALKPISIPGLAGARGVSVGVTTDGSGIAVVAEIGCGTQSIELAIGSVAMGFDKVVEVAPSNGALAIDSEVTWIQSRQEWLVTWISAAGGGHLLARRFTPDGRHRRANDPSVKASVAMPTGVGDVLTFDGTSVFSDIGIGCKP